MSCSSEESMQVDGAYANASIRSLCPESCEAQDHDTVWTLSGTTMKAYAAMRGLPDMQDPLMTWIASLEADKRVEGEVTLLGDIENSIKDRFDWKARGPAVYDEDELERKSIFTFDRPSGLTDLKPPEALDTGKPDDIYLSNDCVADGWGKYAASVVSDNGEGDPIDGRISPDTFALWSEGTKRWDEQINKGRFASEQRKTYEIPNERQRPCSPNTVLPRRTKHRRARSLYDVEDGKELSPECSAYARSQPSILWSPPPLIPRLPPANSAPLFYLMDPEMMSWVRMMNTSPEPNWGVKTASEPEVYGRTEFDAAIGRYWGREKTQQIADSRRREVAVLTLQEEEVNAEADRLRHQARHLKHENRKLADCYSEFRNLRDRRIMRQVHGVIRDLDWAARTKIAEIKARSRERDELRREVDGYINVQGRLLEFMGKKTPEEVFEMYPDIWEPEEIRKNRRNFS